MIYITKNVPWNFWQLLFYSKTSQLPENVFGITERLFIFNWRATESLVLLKWTGIGLLTLLTQKNWNIPRNENILKSADRTVNMKSIAETQCLLISRTASFINFKNLFIKLITPLQFKKWFGWHHVFFIQKKSDRVF